MELRPIGGETLGVFLRRVRVERGMKLPELAEALKQFPADEQISQPYLSQIELGRAKQPSRLKLQRVAEVLRIAPNDLVSLAGLEVEQSEKAIDALTQQITLRVAEMSSNEKHLVLRLIDAVREERRKK